MSRSFHQRHGDSHKGKCPREILEVGETNGVKIFVWRNRKIKPYGRKDFIGYGEEMYSKKYGEYIGTVVDKKRERRRAKEQIFKEINDYETCD